MSVRRFIAPVALVVAVIAVLISGWLLLRSSQEPAASAEQTDQARVRICDAFTTVHQALSIQTNVDLGSDAVAREAVAANARLATITGGQYLMSRLDPATPSELAAPVRTFAANIEDIGMSQLVGRTNSDPHVMALMAEAQSAGDQVAQQCA
ncbi:hypothetical protein BVC93_08945 [Mycobacterium sp. MS1601]|uniref:hypothetical protein n=1 Tax=Mycobacterium sp. MS1601 TaxID=1936029 RepID=UPI0009790D20|nr:hypothetical protein [Mycobacterium sp. MS1601]AQA02536.1 hypothetical protein BVC93_08945 [Mycobacterium sp. MS1601]